MVRDSSLILAPSRQRIRSLRACHVMLDSRWLSAPGCCTARLSCRLFAESTFVSRLVVCLAVVCRGTSCAPPTAFPFGHRGTVGVPPGPTGVHPESRMTLRQRANPLSCWVESCCSVMVVFVFAVVVEVVRNAFGCN